MVVLLLTLPVTARARSCAPLNLITAPNSPFNRIPVADQDGIGLCYAYVGAQLINYQLVRQGRAPSVHQLFLGVEYTLFTPAENRAGSIQGGNTAEAIRQLQSRGNCPAARVREALASLAQKANSREVDIFAFIIKVSERLVELQGQRTRVGGGSLTDADVSKAYADTRAALEPYCQPGTRLEQIFPELQALAIAAPEIMLQGILAPFCREREPLSLPAPNVRRFQNTMEATAAISEKITTNQSPVSITYCAQVLFDGAHVGLVRTPSTAETTVTLAADCGLHESLIVGQRPVADGGCEFLLRNTWGTNFGRDTANHRCLCRHRRTGAFVDNCTNATHNNGQYAVEACWIGTEALGANAAKMTWM